MTFSWTRSIGAHELDLILSIPGSTDPDEVSLLYELARQTTRGCIVEVGGAKGRSTAALALGSKRGVRPPRCMPSSPTSTSGACWAACSHRETA